MLDLNATAGDIIGFNQYLAIIPCILLGFLVGVANYFKPFLSDDDYKGTWKKFLASATSSAVISFVIFAVLDSTNLTFMTKLAISCAVAFLGIDKAVDLVERLLSLRNGGRQ